MVNTPKRSLEQIAETLETNLIKRMEEFEAQVNIGKGATAKDSSQLASDFQSFKAVVFSVIKLLRQQMAELDRSLDNTEMRHRRKFLVLSGVPESTNEEVKAIVIDVLKGKLRIPDVPPTSIKSSYRLGTASDGHPRPILIKFAEADLRSMAWRNKAHLKGSSFVLSEFLTRHRQALFIAARRHFGMRSVWTLDGNINIKTPNGSHSRVFTQAELDALVAVHGGSAEGGSKKTSSGNKTKPSTSTPRLQPPAAPKVEQPKEKRSTRK